MEVLKSHLGKIGFSLSNWDVFIKGVGSEIDLLVIRKAATPQYDLIYEPHDVIAAFEVKKRGSYGEEGTSNIRTTFDKIKSINPNIFCCYIALLERVCIPTQIGHPFRSKPASHSEANRPPSN